MMKFLLVFLERNLLPSIGDRVNATNDDTTIENESAIAVSLNKVPEIPSIKSMVKILQLKLML